MSEFSHSLDPNQTPATRAKAARCAARLGRQATPIYSGIVGRRNAAHGAIDCVVRNLSERGACLKVESPVGIPETFDLVLEGDDIVRPCRVVWQKDM
jgi:hypothetical protein